MIWNELSPVVLLLGISSLTMAAHPLSEPKLMSDGYNGEKDWTIHDPSYRVIVMNDGSGGAPAVHMIAATGKGNGGGYDCGLETYWRSAGVKGDWRPGQCLFTTVSRFFRHYSISKKDRENNKTERHQFFNLKLIICSVNHQSKCIYRNLPGLKKVRSCLNNLNLYVHSWHEYLLTE